MYENTSSLLSPKQPHDLYQVNELVESPLAQAPGGARLGELVPPLCPGGGQSILGSPGSCDPFQQQRYSISHSICLFILFVCFHWFTYLSI